MKSIAIATIGPNTFLTGQVYLDENYILFTPEIPVNEEVLSRLRAWGIVEIWGEEHVESKSTGLEGVNDGDVTSAFLVEESEEHQKKAETKKFYVKLLEFAHKFFDQYLKKNTLPVEALTDQMKNIISMLKNNRRFLLRFTELDREGFSYLISHTVNTAILGIAIGDNMKLPSYKLIEIGMACLLHEVGMYRLPDTFQNAQRTLTVEEKRALTAHPILGYRLLKELNYPPNVTMGVLEHHEKEDGTGYPQKLTGDKITLSAKIVSVASAYDAQISSRPYRDARTGHLSLIDLLKESGKSYDDQVLKRLVYTLSLYPIGSLLELNNGALAMVHDSNPEAPKQPDLKLFTDERKNPLADFPIVKMAENPSLSVKKVLGRDEVTAYRADKIIPA